jgi:NADH-quinone oxidoreductase subunit J
VKLAFEIASLIAVLSTIFVISARNAVHALLYLIVSLLSVATLFFLLRAPFAAALEVIIYAGAIMVLFVFAILMVGLGPKAERNERLDMRPSHWVLPALLAALLLFVFLYVILSPGTSAPSIAAASSEQIGPKQVGLALFGPYLLLVELAGILLLAGVLGASHLGKRGPHG